MNEIARKCATFHSNCLNLYCERNYEKLRKLLRKYMKFHVVFWKRYAARKNKKNINSVVEVRKRLIMIKKQNINTSLCWDTFFEKSRGPRAEWVLKCWNQSFSGNDERVANASTCSNIYTNGITRSDEEWCWWLTVAQIQSFLRPPHPLSANSCSYSPLLEYHQHQPFDT